MSALERIYARLPVFGQNAAVSAYGMYWHWLRFGPGYQRHLAGWQAREAFTALAWQDWTAQRLRAFLTHAATHVPAYRESWTETDKQAARAGLLAELPLLDKAPLRRDPRAFVRDDVRAPELVFHTSGSTGTPIASIWTRDELRNSLALREARSAGWAGVSFKLPRATFSGRMVEPDPESKGPFHRFNRAEQQVYFSAFHLSPETAERYVRALHQHGVLWLTGYAVSLYLLAKAMRDQALAPPTLGAIVTTSEKLTAPMRAVMTEAYGCPVFEEYSTVENAVFASECEQGSLHVSPEAGVVEILRPDGTPCDPGEPGEVVATGVLRDHQPLVRFRLGDVASWSTSPCSCGRALPVLAEVAGRVEDVVIGPDGRQMVRFHGVFVDLPAVEEGQVIQESLERIRVRVVPSRDEPSRDERSRDEANSARNSHSTERETFGPHTVAEIEDRIHQRLGHDVTVEVEAVSRIPRTAAGKFQAVVSKLAKPVSDD